MIPYDQECVTRLLRRMPPDRLKSIRSTDFQRWPALQRECEAKAHAIAVGAEKPTPEMTEAWERANKKWLPAGKRSANGKEERERRQAFSERQIDLEDAIEAAGGARGGLAA